MEYLSLKIEIGKRNYFDCYEFCVGSLINYYLKNLDLVKPIYSIFDTFTLGTDGETIAYLYPRAFDVNQIALDFFSFEIHEYESLVNLKENVVADEPFYIDFDEFYIEGYRNFNKKHVKHASLATKIQDVGTIKIFDPVLDFTRNVCCDPKIFRVPEHLHDKRAILYKVVKKKKSQKFHHTFNNKNYDESIMTFCIDNLKLWEFSESCKSENLSFFYGLNALHQFREILQNEVLIKIAASQFYEWIFPLAWKKEYVEKSISPENQAISNLLGDLILQMETVETILLRLTSSKSSTLKKSAEVRWGNLIALFEKYIALEKKRIQNLKFAL